MPERARRVTCVALVTVALTWGWPGDAAACEPMSAYQAIVAPASGVSTISVPVTIHVMERPGRECETRDVWTSAKVKLLFGPAVSDFTVASIWGETRIRFVVKAVLRQPFEPPPALMDSDRGEVTTPASGPLGTPPWEDAFGTLVRRFHRRGHVNVYLWRTLANTAGYGRSPRSGDGKATVWLAGKCVDGSLPPENCARVTAHELGHALGLYHSGPGRCAAVSAEFQSICMLTTESCGERSPNDRLMRPGEDGRMLCAQEVTAAEEMIPSLR